MMDIVSGAARSRPMLCCPRLSLVRVPRPCKFHHSHVIIGETILLSWRFQQLHERPLDYHEFVLGSARIYEYWSTTEANGKTMQ